MDHLPGTNKQKKEKYRVSRVDRVHALIMLLVFVLKIGRERENDRLNFDELLFLINFCTRDKRN